MTIAKAIWMSLTRDVVSYRGWNTWRCSAFFHFKHTSKPRPSEATLKSSKEAAQEERTQAFQVALLLINFYYFTLNRSYSNCSWVRGYIAWHFPGVASLVLLCMLLFSVDQSVLNSPFTLCKIFFFFFCFFQPYGNWHDLIVKYLPATCLPQDGCLASVQRRWKKSGTFQKVDIATSSHWPVQ